MKRRHIADISTAVLTSLGTTIYWEELNQLAQTNGFWLVAPLYALLLSGIIALSHVLEKVVIPKAEADGEIHDAHFPRPSVRAFDWNHWLTASPESVAEAMANAKVGRSAGFNLLREDWGRIYALWEKRGWTIRRFEPDTDYAQIAVLAHSEWAGSQIDISGWSNVFKSEPRGSLDDRNAARVAGHFMGWEDEPEGVAWCRLKED